MGYDKQAPDTMSGDQDAELIQHIAEGDVSAFTQFYRLHAQRVLRFCTARLAQDQAIAEDVLHETMLEVWRTAHRFKGRSRPGTWVLAIAHHKLVDYLRRQGRRREDDLPDEIADDDEVSAADALSALQDADRLHACLDQLPSVQRAALHLAFFEDLPYHEIARILDCPEGTVKTRIFHAKKALKLCLSARH